MTDKKMLKGPEEIFIRAHVEPIGKPTPDKPPQHKPKDVPKWRQYSVVFDTETRIDLGQSLTFGVYHVLKLQSNPASHCGATYQLIEGGEGIFHADDLPEHERKVLEDYVNTYHSDAPCFPPRFPLLSRSEFVHRILYRYAKKGAAIVGFNLPFDLSRIAILDKNRKRRDGKGRKREFSFVLSEYASGIENLHDPRVTIEPLDSKKAFISFWREWKCGNTTQINDARFLDLHTALWALFNKSYSLKSASSNERDASGKYKGPFGPLNLPQKIDHKPTGMVTFDEITYARQDVRCTAALLNAVKQEFDLHPIPLRPEQAYSPASFAKSVLDAMGIKKPKEFNVPAGILNVAMESFTGGRAETRIRLAEVPVVPVDLTSEYPSVCVLLGLFNILTAERLEFPDCTEQAREMLANISLDDCFNRERWKDFLFFVRIKPNADLLPVRQRYNGITTNVGNNFLTSDTPIWITGLDAIASRIRTGKTPEVLEAFRVIPVGKQKRMQPVKLRGMIEIDPYHDDLFKKVIELRKDKTTDTELAYWLKIYANSMYGFFAEMNPEEVRTEIRRKVKNKKGKPVLNKDGKHVQKCERLPVQVQVFKGKDGSFPHTPKKDDPRDRTVTIESEGKWYAPYLASLIVGGGRLLLSMIEESATRAGMTYLYADTDALGLVASEHGGSLDHVPGCREKGIRVGTWKQVDELLSRFDDFCPYDHAIIPHLLTLTGDNWIDKSKTKRRHLLGISISAKRYALYERDGENITIVNAKAHGLGHLYPPAESPAGWDDTHEIPKWIFDAWEWIIRRTLGLKQITLPFAQTPLLMREAVTTVNVLNQLHTWMQMRPFNFFMRPVLSSFHNGENVSLVCPLETNPAKWLDMRCTNAADPNDKNEHFLTLDAMKVAENPWQYHLVKTFRNMLHEYTRHPEAKSLGSNGERCTGRTTGLLEPDHVHAGEIIRTSKEHPRGIEEGDKPSEIMDFQMTVYYENPKQRKPEMVQPTIGHVQKLRKHGYRKLIRQGCSRRFLDKVKHQMFVKRIAMQDYERAVQRCEMRKRK